ncbi:MAG: hypothetical protein ACK47B_20360 [Armatimonadota bacterium]
MSPPSPPLGRIALAAAPLLLAASPAWANGAMGLALATFAWGPWLAYVAATLLFEALLLGRWLRVPPLRALGCAFTANLLTAGVGGFFSGIFVYGLDGILGSRLNPNPFGSAVLLFTLFGLLSATVEALVWRRAPSKSGSLPLRRVFGASVAVHLLGVPLGLAILLLPERPYPGLEGRVGAHRQVWLQGQFRRAVEKYVESHAKLPPERTYGELLQRFRPQLGDYAGDPHLWAAAYVPRYHRFDTVERRRHPVEWNVAAAGERIDTGPPRTLWLLRYRSGGYHFGLVMELPGFAVRRSNDAAELSFKTAVDDE